MAPEDRDEARFRRIARCLEVEDSRVRVSRMLSSPGLKYGDRVFAFYHRAQMVFKLGKGLDPSSFGVSDFSPLNPFKTRPPLAGWYQVPSSDGDKWEGLARLALQLISSDGAD